MKLLLESRIFKNEKMEMLSNLVSEIGGIIDSLTLSSKEKMQLRASLTEALSRFEADLQKEQSSVIRSESEGNWLQRSWRPLVMLTFSAVVLLGIFTPLPLPDDGSRFWDLLEIGLGGYVVGRSFETVSLGLGKRIKNLLKK